MNASLRRRWRPIVWFGIAAALWLGVAAPLHGLAHAMQAVQAAAQNDALPSHAQTCEQCLQFASIDGALPACTSALPSSGAAGPASPPFATPRRAQAFSAYISRAPPPLG